jgi:phenylpropionate dioxygenase-like ring-hydroxylating dioxygenase large terminal subunit
MSEAPIRRRGARLPRQGEGGYDQCWYPLALSRDVPPGSLSGRDFLSGRVVVWRGGDGVARVHSAYCRHLGADLSVGKVVGDELRCAFHHWRYDGAGACRATASGEPVPRDARLYAFPTAERFGLVWAFNGAEPLYPVPGFSGRADADLVVRTTPAPDHKVDPWTLLTNSVDLQHLRALHGLEIDEPKQVEWGEHGVEYDSRFVDPRFGAMEQHIRVFGTNCIALSGTMGGVELLSMFAGTPTPSGVTKGWTVTATSHDPADPVLGMAEAFFQGLIAEDGPVMNTIHFREDVLLGADRLLARFLKYLRGYPRANPAEEFLS